MTGLVSNTSPLIILAKAGLLDLLPKLYSEVVAPQGVLDEISAGPDDAIKLALPHCHWLSFIILDPPLSPLATMQLGRGEAEAIELARRKIGWSVLLDDRAGRRAALALGLKPLGTLSVIALASQHSLVSSFDEAVDRLRSAGLFVSDEVIEEVRKGMRTVPE